MALRHSPQRERIYQAVASSREHPTAQMVYRHLRPELPQLSLGTVYRNLRQLAQEGRLRELDGPVARYDSVLPPHGHVRCVRCGALSDAAAAHGQRAEVRIELDTGYARAGVQRDEILEFAKRVSAMPGLDLGGIFTFKSATLAGKPTLDLRAAAEEEGRLLSETAELLRSNGIPIRDVSGGSTPTGELVAAYPGITEIRPGTYIFQDVSELRQGVAEPEECCAVVKVTVVSTPTPYRAVIDGGSKVFAADKKPMTPPVNLPGFGRIVGHDELIFDHMNEEHGVIVRNDAPTGLKVGDTLYIVPNHVCTTMNLFDFVYLREKDGSYTRTRVDGRGRVW